MEPETEVIPKVPQVNEAQNQRTACDLIDDVVGCAMGLEQVVIQAAREAQAHGEDRRSQLALALKALDAIDNLTDVLVDPDRGWGQLAKLGNSVERAVSTTRMAAAAAAADAAAAPGVPRLRDRLRLAIDAEDAIAALRDELREARFDARTSIPESQSKPVPEGDDS